MKKKNFWISIGALLALTAFIYGCVAPQQTVRQEQELQEGADVDALLGLTDTQGTAKNQEAESQNALTEQEVLDMFGIGEKENAAEVSKATEETQGNAAVTEEAHAANAEAANTRTVTDAAYTEPGIAWRSTNFDDRYKEAFTTYQTSKYEEAIRKFEALLNMDVKHKLSVNCQYWIGESYYGLGNYPEAVVAFEKVFSFEQDQKDDDAQLKLGICYLRMNDKDRAKLEFQKLVDAYPKSEYVNRAQSYLRQLGQ